MQTVLRAALAVVVVTTATFVGCKCSKDTAPPAGSGATGATGGGLLSSGALTTDQFCDKSFGSAVDEILKGCTPEDKASPDYQLVSGMAGLGATLCKQLVGNAVSKKRATFDGEKAGKCADALRATVFKNDKGRRAAAPPPECDGVVVGQEDTGQPCGDDVDCKDGLACIGNGNPLEAGDGGAKDGVCTKPAAVGAKCEREQGTSIGFGGKHPTCAPDAFCDALEHTCKAAGGAGAKCTSQRQCASGLACHLAKCGDEKPAAAGGACLDDPDCDEGLYCDGANVFDEPPKPGKCAAKKAAGAECRGPIECKGRCDLGDAGMFGGGATAKGKCVAFCGSG